MRRATAPSRAAQIQFSHADRRHVSLERTLHGAIRDSQRIRTGSAIAKFAHRLSPVVRLDRRHGLVRTVSAGNPYLKHRAPEVRGNVAAQTIID